MFAEMLEEAMHLICVARWHCSHKHNMIHSSAVISKMRAHTHTHSHTFAHIHTHNVYTIAPEKKHLNQHFFLLQNHLCSLHVNFQEKSCSTLLNTASNEAAFSGLL